MKPWADRRIMRTGNDIIAKHGGVGRRIKYDVSNIKDKMTSFK